MVFLGGSAGTESVCNEGDLGLTPGLGRSPGEGNGYPLQYSGLENSKHSIVDEVPKESDTTEWLSLNAFCKMVRHFQAICNLKDSFFTSEAKVTLLTPFTILTDLIKRWERTEETYICPMFITVGFIIAEIGETSMHGLRDAWMKKMCTHTLKCSQSQETWNLASFNNMDGSWGYYAKWNLKKRQILWFHS